MAMTRLSTKGRIVLPKAIRDSRSWGPGMAFVVEEVGDGVLLRPLARFGATELDDVVGCLGSRRNAATTAEMRAAVGQAVRLRAGRGRY